MNPAFPAPSADDDLFEAETYSDWVGRSIQARTLRTDAMPLFESTISEPTTALFEIIRQAFSTALSPHYVSVFAGGNCFALDALAARYGIPRRQLISTTGATSAIGMALRALIHPGDRVLVETPGFDLLGRLAEEAGAGVDRVRRPAPDFRVDLADLRANLTPRTRAVMITNLHNPSGAWLSPAEIREIAAVAAETGAVLIVDEVYADFAQPNVAPPAAMLAPNVVTVSSLTKVFGLFSLKFGWLCAAPDLLARIRASAPDGDVGISKLSHAIAADVLDQSAVFDRHWTTLLAAGRPIVARHVAAMTADGLLEGDLPEFGCMYFPRVVGVDDTRALASRLWRDHGLLVAPGEYFDLPGHIRLGFGSDPGETDEGLGRLHAALAAGRR